MTDFTVRSDSVDVEQIMRQIRARVREKRGADYTEAELQQLANVKLETFLDPRGVRSDLVDAFRRHRIVSADPPKYEFEDTTLYDTHRGVLRAIRRLLHPILKLFINPNPLIHAMHVQAQINAEFHRRFREREEMDPLFYEVVHNLVVELTRAGIEIQNLKMRVESLSSRMDFDERRARSLEGVVEYRPIAPQRPAADAAAPPSAPGHTSAPAPSARPELGGPRPEGGGPGSPDRRRRRRRRRRRPGQTMGDAQGGWGSRATPGSETQAGGTESQSTAPDEYESEPDGPHEPDSPADDDQ